MNKKKIFLLILILVVITAVVFFILKNNIIQFNSESDEIVDYTPEEEISDEQLKETIVTLYFLNSQTGDLKSEGRLINANDLIENPYKAIVQLLIDGPKNSDLVSVFPENVTLINCYIENNCVILDFSDELLNISDENHKFNIINSILNSLNQLNEVNSIKFLISGNESDEFSGEYFS